MCTLAQTLTYILNTITNNNMNNIHTPNTNKVTVMASNKIEWNSDYDVDLNSNHPVYSNMDEDMQFEAEIEALYNDTTEVPTMSATSMEAIMAFAAQQAWVKKDVNNVNSDVNEEDAMCNNNCPVCENGASTNMLCNACEETMLNESYVDKHGSDTENVMKNEENKMFSIAPVLALASANMSQDRMIILATLVVLILAMIAAFVGMFLYENKQIDKKVAKQLRKMAAELEQQRRHEAMIVMQIRERNVEYAREQARAEAELLARREREAAEYAAHLREEQEREARRIARNAETAREIHERYRRNLEKQAELGCKYSAERIKFEDFISSINSSTDINALWDMFDTRLKEEKEITFESFAEGQKNLQQSGDHTFFYENASIQGIRSYWLMVANLDENDRPNVVYGPLGNLFSDFARALEKAMRSSETDYYHFISMADWQCGFSGQAYRILTKAEWEAAKLLVSKNGYKFFSRWCMPLNDAATGGLLIAMSKDPKFADQMSEIKENKTFWHSKEMNAQKSLWKANQWRNYLQRHEKVCRLAEDLIPIFARVETATCKLTTDVVVGFNFDKKEFESCDVADTRQVEKILAAGYDQVLRIRRTDAKGIWEESQQINNKYTGKFCTGHGTKQSDGYYQGTFLNGTNIPWIADIQINGEWDNFGVILTNSAGVVDFGMGNDNRSSKHRPVLFGMFGDATANISLTPGQLEANAMLQRWFVHREFNINHVVAAIKSKLEAAANDDVW